MSQLSQFTAQQLERAAAIKRQIESLQQELESIEGAGVTPKRESGRPRVVKIDSRIEGLKKARAVRLAKLAAKKNASTLPAPQAATVAKAKGKKKRTVSPEIKAKLAEAAKARWAKAKASGKTKL